MLKAQYTQRGPNPVDVIEAVECDKPVLEQGQVLLELLASPINPSDVLTLTGQYGILPPLPAIGGNEGVAKVAEVGPGVEGLPVGQTVLLPVGIGTWQTHIVASAAKLVPLPNEADPVQLSMVTINPPTASLMLSEFVDLKEGDWVIQNAANSGVGNYLIKLAKMRGLKTVNIVRRESLVQPLLDQGADVVVVDGDDLHERVAQATENANIQLGIDAIGGPATARLGACLGNDATLVNYGMMSGVPCELPASLMVFKGITVKGFWLAKWFEKASKQEQMALYGELTKLIATGQLTTPVDSTYPVKDIKQAIAAAAQGERNGKIIVTA